MHTKRRRDKLYLTAVSPFVVGIFTKPDPSHIGWLYGTGSPVEFEGRRFILTAAHVVSVKPYDIQFVAPPNGGFLISPYLQIETFRRSRRFDLKCCIGDGTLDVAAIIPKEPIDLAFFDLSKCVARSPDVGSQVVICGYPIAKERMILLEDDVRSCASPDFQCARVIPPTSVPVMQPHQFAIDYPEMRGIVQPPGYSGSMAWYDTAGYRSIQDIRRQLTIAPAGVITHHSPVEQAVLGTRIESVITFIRDQVLPCFQGDR